MEKKLTWEITFRKMRMSRLYGKNYQNFTSYVYDGLISLIGIKDNREIRELLDKADSRCIEEMFA